MPRDWDAEIDRWTERFRQVESAPEPFATAIREGWDPIARAGLAADAEAYASATAGFLNQLATSGWGLVRFDARPDDCGVCSRYAGSAYHLDGEDGLPEPPPLPICPACRHTLNPLTPYFMQSAGLDIEDLVDTSVPFDDDAV